MPRRLPLPLATTLVLFTFAPVPAADDKLEGTWTVIAAEENGKPADRLKGHVLTFAGDRFTIKEEGKVIYQGTFKLGADQKPATYDITLTEGAGKGKTWKGIYALDGDTLKMCDNASDTDKARPKEFAAKADSGHVLLTLKRGGKP